MSTSSFAISIPPLPEGWTGTPDDFIVFLNDNARFISTGDALAGQVGGSRPTTDVGLFINGQQIEVWRADIGEYRPITTVPIGTVIDWCGSSNTPPDNYLMADGSLVLIATYQELYDVIGRSFTDASADPLYFRLPDGKGRVFAGAGIGNYNPTSDAAIHNGVMIQREIGEYYGHEWLSFREVTPAGSQTPRYNPLMAATPDNTSRFIGVSQPTVFARKLIRYK